LGEASAGNRDCRVSGAVYSLLASALIPAKEDFRATGWRIFRVDPLAFHINWRGFVLGLSRGCYKDSRLETAEKRGRRCAFD
jgi:hypothetical protein